MDSVTLVWWPRYETERSSCHTREAGAARCVSRSYRAVIQTDGISAYTRYALLFKAAARPSGSAKTAFRRRTTGKTFEFLWPNPTDAYRAPDWASEQVYYQIFPERFRNGEASNDPPARALGRAADAGEFPGRRSSRYHRKSSGTSAISAQRACISRPYSKRRPTTNTTPWIISTSIPPSARRTISRSLSAQPTSSDCGVLLDGVFNHCGYYWPPFQDVVRNGESSGYASWFFPQSFPVNEKLENYDCVGHYKWMPKINLADAGARIISSRSASTGYATSTSTAGGWMWRTSAHAVLGHFSDAIKRKPGRAPARRNVGGRAPAARPRPARQRDELSLPDAAADWLAKIGYRPRARSPAQPDALALSVGKRRCGSITRSTATIPSASAGSAATSGGTACRGAADDVPRLSRSILRRRGRALRRQRPGLPSRHGVGRGEAG